MWRHTSKQTYMWTPASTYIHTDTHTDVFKLSRPSEPHLPAIMFCLGNKTRADCRAGGAGRRTAAAAAGKHPAPARPTLPPPPHSCSPFCPFEWRILADRHVSKVQLKQEQLQMSEGDVMQMLCPSMISRHKWANTRSVITDGLDLHAQWELEIASNRVCSSLINL